MMRSDKPLLVVLIGPECTGKSWLAAELARRYGVLWSPEFAREYVESKAGPISYADVDMIGLGQKSNEDAVVSRASELGMPFVVLDTDLVSTLIYSRHYYGLSPAWIEREARQRLADLYLLHHIDVEWKEDGFQREAQDRREELFESFRSTLNELGAEVADIKGDWEDRRRKVIEHIDRLLAGQTN
jgi:NadR type nicotinamide-nucleotide adenylyltransferase